MTTPPTTMTTLCHNHPTSSPDHNHPTSSPDHNHPTSSPDHNHPMVTTTPLTDYHHLLNPTGHRQILYKFIYFVLLYNILEEIEIIILFRPKEYLRILDLVRMQARG
jgi:hypothetical protein